jgi:hypothetical protein
MGCPAFSNATAASLTVSASFASEARTMSQQIFCTALKTPPRPYQIIRLENVDLFAFEKSSRVISQGGFVCLELCLFETLFVWNIICWTFICLELGT